MAKHVVCQPDSAITLPERDSVHTGEIHMNNKIKYSPGLIAKLLKLLEQKGVTDENLQEIGIKSGLLSDVAEAIAAGRPINREKVRRALGLSKTFCVDYGRSLTEMIKVGQYDRIEISEDNFKISGEGRGVVEFESTLFEFKCHTGFSDEKCRLIMEDDPDNPWMPAEIEHILAYGEMFPDEQKKYDIYGLGSSCIVNCNRDAPVLSYFFSRNLIRRFWYHGYVGCPRGVRFLAVRKVISN
ncbi:MAG: hypothetical protein HGA38_05715 [Candidatus Moranbacteria bacterium]|nr:hypothetical protein [Candidatus Moranbacteria bacterium]